MTESGTAPTGDFHLRPRTAIENILNRRNEIGISRANDGNIERSVLCQPYEVDGHRHINTFFFGFSSSLGVGPAGRITERPMEDVASRCLPCLALLHAGLVRLGLKQGIGPAGIQANLLQYPVGITGGQDSTHRLGSKLPARVRGCPVVEERPPCIPVEVLGIHKHDNALHAASLRKSKTPSALIGRRGRLTRIMAEYRAAVK